MILADANAPGGLVSASIRSGDTNVLRLAVAQALLGANSTVVYAIVGNMLSSSLHAIPKA
jgi:hypothetical protein